MSTALPLTLVAILLHPIGSGWLRPALLALAAAGLVLPALRERPWLWLALATLAALRVVLGWPLADNHAYLLAYWLLAVGLVRLTPDPERLLAWNARTLIGLVFAFATLWKLISPDYLDGRFFRVALLEDRRLEWIAQHAGGLDDAELAERRRFVTQHVDGPAFAREAPPEPERVARLAAVATWATLALEAVVALAFLAPLGRFAPLRHALLLAFCAVTYAVAPVVGFGWLLLAMGVARCDAAARRTRWAYLFVFVLLVFYDQAARLSVG